MRPTREVSPSQALLGKPTVSSSKGVFNPTLQKENSKVTSLSIQCVSAEHHSWHLQLPVSLCALSRSPDGSPPPHPPGHRILRDRMRFKVNYLLPEDYK